METLISALMTTYSIGPKRLSKSGTACSLEPGEEALCWELGGGGGGECGSQGDVTKARAQAGACYVAGAHTQEGGLACKPG